MATITIAQLLNKDVSLHQEAEKYGFEIVKTKTAIKIKSNGKTVVNLKASSDVNYGVFAGYDFDFNEDDEDDQIFVMQDDLELLKKYIVVDNGNHSIYF